MRIQAKYGLGLIVLLLPVAAFPQCNLSYQEPTANLLKVGSFSGWAIQNSTFWEDNVYLTEEITTTSGEPILKEESPSFGIGKGTIPVTATANPQFSNSIAKTYYDRTGRLPYDNYIICVELKLHNGNRLIGKTCQNINLLLNPPQLISPFNQEHIPPVQPVFNWLAPQNPLAETRDFSYTINIVELHPGQSGMEAINSNPSILLIQNLKITSYLYSPSSPELIPGHDYAWQVSAFINTQPVGKTEVWTFTPDSLAKKTKPAIVSSQSFTELKRKLDGGIVQTINNLRFKLDNGETIQPDHLTIYDETRNNITPTQLQFAAIYTANRYEIDLLPYKNFKDKHTYYLEFQSMRGEIWKMAFRYSRVKKPKNT
jgi:hypothetical protein